MNDVNKPQVLNIQDPVFQRVQITIRGKLLLTSRPPDVIKPPPKPKGRVKTGLKDPEAEEVKVGSPEDQWAHSAYMMPGGIYGFPAAAIVRCVVDTANTFFPSPTNPKYGIRRETISGSFSILGDDLLPIHFEGEPIKRHDIGRNKRGMLVDVYRLSFPNWSLTFKVDFDPALMPLGKLIAILKQAGFSTGIGPWRPQRGGTKGRFVVDNEIRELEWTPEEDADDAAA